jgi:6-phosphogluconolactonase (cycloisomerase 2 family)
MKAFTFLAALPLSLVAAAPALQQRQAPTSKTVLVGASGQLLSFSFDGTAFTKKADANLDGFNPSWMIFKEPNFLYTVNENSNTTLFFTFDRATGAFVKKQELQASTGIVHLEFNADKTRLVGSSFTNGTVDVWDTSAADGSFKLLKTVPSPATPEKPGKAHQAVLDPTGRFFVVNDLGAEKIHILDSKDDKFSLTSVSVFAGCGPRHGAFHKDTATGKATHYYVVCENGNKILSFHTDYAEDGTLSLGCPGAPISTFSADVQGRNETAAKAGELIIDADQTNLFITNRVTGNTQDDIVRFPIAEDGTLGAGAGTLSGGISPRMISFSKDKGTLFVAHQAAGLLAFKVQDGALVPTPAATLEVATDAAKPASQGFGPEFVLEV